MTESSGSTRATRPAAAAPLPESALVTPSIRIAAAWSWRVIVVIVALIPIGWLISQASIIVIPLLAAILVTALLVPLTNLLTVRFHWPKWLALIAAMITLLAALAALGALVVLAFRTGRTLDAAQLQVQYRSLLEWVEASPLHITQAQVDEWLSGAVTWVQSNVGTLLQGTLSAGSTVASVITGTFVTAFAVIFYLLDGRRIWLFLVSMLPVAARAPLDGAAERGWVTVGHYVRVQVIVAFIDALGIFLGAVILNVPYALAIGIIVFIVAFIPFVGAIISGILACVIALIANGPVNALLMLVVVVAVLQLEAHVLQPLIMGQAVKLHPLAVLVSVSAGSLFGGIAGAVFAVPIVAVAKVMIRYIASGAGRDQPDPTRALSREDDSAPPASLRRAEELRERLSRARHRSATESTTDS